MRRNSHLLQTLICTVVFASPFFVTATPANAADIQIATPSDTSYSSLLVDEGQSYTVPSYTTSIDVDRDAYTATSQATLDKIAADKKAAADKIAAAAKAKQDAEIAAKLKAQIAAASVGQAQTIQNSTAEAKSLNLNTTTTPAKAAFVQEALAHVGVPYVFGGATPSGWDCSGYVLWVYQQQTGITMPHSVGAIKAGYTKPVSYADAQPGDLVFFSGPAGVNHHVGIYLGNGMMVHASKPGDLTHVAPIWWTENVTFGSLYN